MIKIRVITFSAFLVSLMLLTLNGRGQFFYYGQEPSSLNWKQLKTSNFSFYFTEDADLQAYYYARLMEKTRSFFSGKTGIYPQHTDVILHNRSSVSNGFSVPAPLRMEINTVAPQSITATDWLQQLGIHEYQHSEQIEEFRRGFAKNLTWLLGDAAIAGAMARMPFWFIEGEAVVRETAYSESGRGRDADFTMKLRAAMAEHGIYSYDKAINGSFKDYQLNYYNLGYHLVAEGIKKYSDTLWRNVRKHTADKPYGITPFARAIKNQTQMKMEDFYKEAMRDVVSRSRKRNFKTFDWDTLSTPSGNYKSYTHAGKVENQIYAYRESYSDIPAFIKIQGNGEKVIHYPGSVFDEKIAIGDSAFYWAEYYRDKRWELKNYSVIKKYNIKSREEKVLTPEKSRYFAPDMAPDKPFLVAVKANYNSTYTLVILHSGTGEIVYSRDFPAGVVILTPRWSADGSEIVFVKVTKDGKSIHRLQQAKDKVSQILGSTHFDLSHPYLTRNYLFFTAPLKGKNDLYALKLKTRDLYQITDAKFGVNYPTYHPSGQIILSDYTAEGYKLRSFDVKDALWQRTSFPAGEPFHLASQIKKRPIDFSNLPELNEATGSYQKGTHLFNFHSLTPFGYSKNSSFYGPGISVHSQNLMSSMFTSAGYYYDYDDEGGNYFLDVAYEGWYPRLTLHSSYGKRERVLRVDQKRVPVKWNEVKIAGTIDVPFNFNAGKYRRYLSLGLTGDYRMNDIYNPDTLRFTFDRFFSITPRIFFYNLRRESHMDLYPRFGQRIDVQYQYSWLPETANSRVFSAQGWLYFPGFTQNHHLRIYSGYEHSNRVNRPLSGFIRYPRGSGKIFHEEIWMGQLNYSFPLFYPEWNVGRWMYFKRIKMNLFMDAARVKYRKFDDAVYTTGFELFADTHFFRLIAPASPGFRAVLDLEENELTFEFLFRMNFNIY